MQYDDGGDHSDFWGDDQPTRQLRRVQPGKRSHDHTGSIPVVATRPRRSLNVLGARAVRATAPEAEADATRLLRRVEPAQRSPRNTSPLRNMSMVDPLLRRIGMVVAAIVVLIPVAVALRSEPQAQLESVTPPTIGDIAEAAPAVPVPAAVDAPAPAINPADLPALTLPTAPAPSYYVAAELPPAVPSNTQPAATETAAAAATVTTTAAPAATATTAAVVAAAERSGATCSKAYTVASGDFWIGIAKRAQVTLKELLRANNAKSSTKLFPGRSICLPNNAVTPVPAAQPAAATATTTTVKAATPKPAPAPAPTTTVKPTPTTTPAAPAPANNYSREQVVQIIREVWPDDLEDEAIRIATRESNLKPTVRNYCCFGLFQIYYSVHKRWLADLGITSAEMLYDPRVNANAALALYVRAGGWGPWKL